MARSGGKKTSAAVMQLVDIGSAAMVADLGLQPEKARMAMREIAHRWCKAVGGGQLYLQNDKEFELLERDLAIWRDWTGNNIHELVEKYKISDRQIYFILDHLKKHHAKQQAMLPGLDEVAG